MGYGFREAFADDEVGRQGNTRLRKRGRLRTWHCFSALRQGLRWMGRLWVLMGLVSLFELNGLSFGSDRIGNILHFIIVKEGATPLLRPTSYIFTIYHIRQYENKEIFFNSAFI